MKNTALFKTGLAVMAIYFSACKKNDNTPVSVASKAQVTFTIKGDGFTNQNVTITSNKGVANVGGIYGTTAKFTALEVDDRKTTAGDDQNAFLMAVNGNTTGTQKLGTKLNLTDNLEDEVNFVITLNRNGKEFIYDTNGDGFNVKTSGSITITHYGAVGNTIEGDFYGTVVNQITGNSANVTNGHFTMTRLPDVTVID